MSILICPRCKALLSRDGGSLKCVNRHCYDIAKSGYVSLSPRADSGDDREMVRARTDFLDTGAYKPFADKICELLASVDSPIVDAGCGEGYYTNLLALAKEREVCGFDLSKAACDKAAKRAKASGSSAFFGVASLFELPVADGSAGAVVNLFAPVAEAEFARILQPEGLLLIGAAAPRHLYELKAAVYDSPYENEGRRDLPGELFELVSQTRLCYSFVCERPHLASLFAMTPYAFKTSRVDRAKLDALVSLTITAEFDLFLYRRRPR